MSNRPQVHKTALFSYGFRPFFLAGAIWAIVMMLLWLMMLAGSFSLPIRMDPISWHAHEFLYGYLLAIVAGFLLTAIANWTARPPISGWPLAGLLILWLSGRVAIATSDLWPALAVAVVDLAFPIIFALVIAREIIAGQNWRNLIVLILFIALLAGNALFHWEVAQGEFAARGLGLHIGIAASVMLIALIGGRIVPMFTRNWLVKQGPKKLPAPAMGRFDQFALAILLIALTLWVGWPNSAAAGISLLLAGIAHLLRLARWAGHRTGAEPLLWVLHVGYACIPLGAMMLGLSILWPGLIGTTAAQHVWMAGAIGLMTLAMMTRVTLGHTGRELKAGPATTVLYSLLIIAILSRVLAGTLPSYATSLHTLSGLTWIAAFTAFILYYGRALITPRPDA